MFLSSEMGGQPLETFNDDCLQELRGQKWAIMQALDPGQAPFTTAFTDTTTGESGSAIWHGAKDETGGVGQWPTI